MQHKASYAPWLLGPDVRRIPATDEAAVRDALARREPIVIEGALVAKGLAHWSFEYLAEKSDRAKPHFHLHYAPAARRVFPRKYGKQVRRPPARAGDAHDVGRARRGGGGRGRHRGVHF